MQNSFGIQFLLGTRPTGPYTSANDVRHQFDTYLEGRYIILRDPCDDAARPLGRLRRRLAWMDVEWTDAAATI
jgi:hypothetical protein